MRPASWMEEELFTKARRDATVTPEGWNTSEISEMKFWIVHCRPGRCLLQWINDGSSGVKSFVHGLNLRPINAEDKGFDPT